MDKMSIRLPEEWYRKVLAFIYCFTFICVVTRKLLLISILFHGLSLNPKPYHPDAGIFNNEGPLH